MGYGGAAEAAPFQSKLKLTHYLPFEQVDLS
jgi:hypothetical protein